MALNVCCVLIFLLSSIGFLRGDNPATLELNEAPLLNYGPPLDEKSDKNNLEISLIYGQNITFFGAHYNKFYVSKDGVISFEQGFAYNAKYIWEEGVKTDVADRPFIAPFLHDGYDLEASDTYQGKVYQRVFYKRELKEDDDEDEYNLQTIKFLEDYVREAIINVPKDFEIETVIVVTWEDVTTNSDIGPEDCDREDNPCKSATFQAVIVSDGLDTFSMFNYLKMDIPYKKSYQTGFNGGHGRGWYNVIPCHGHCSIPLNLSRVNELPNLQGSDLKGRYVLNVGRERIVRGGCLPTTLVAGMLEVYPSTVGMFGGESLQVSGKCLRPGKPIYCKFGGKQGSPQTKGVMKNSMLGSCPVPILKANEPILVMWSEDGENWTSERMIDVVLPERLGLEKIMDDSVVMTWFTQDAKQLTVQWKASDITDRYDAMVEVNLLGYTENKDKVEFPVLKTLRKTNNRNGRLNIDVSKIKCEKNCRDHDMGLLEVVLTDEYLSAAKDRYAVRYGPFPLGWYVNDRLSYTMGDSWPHEKCRQWQSRDMESPEWRKKLPACPCNVDQAVADFGRWQATHGCNKFKPTKCRFHESATHCVRSVEVTSDGAGNQCCYDKAGSLLYSQITYKGSTPDRSHNNGKRPYDKAYHVPTMSHWLHDVIPFYHCCLWTNNELCNLYMELRDTRDCTDYQVPGRAMLAGDPHITTFDGQMYSFSGKGDFWLLETESFKIQGYFTELPNTWGKMHHKEDPKSFKPTALTHIAMQGSGDIIDIYPAPEKSVTRRGLDIRVGNDRKFFLTESTQKHNYRGFSIICHDLSQSKCTIVDANSVGVTVEVLNDLLHVTVALPPSMKVQEGTRKGMGLLGMYDGKSDNDFVSRQDTVISSNRGAEEIYDDFAMTWNVLGRESLFQVHRQAKPLTEHKPYYNWNSIPHDFDGSPSDRQLKSVCGDDQSCRWDYRITGNEIIARATREAVEEFTDVQTKAAKVNTCGLPNVGRNPVMANNNFTQDNKVTVTGCSDDSEFKGEQSFECITESMAKAKENQRDGYGTKSFEGDVEFITHWVPEPSSVCIKIQGSVGDNDPGLGMIIGIAIGAVAAVIIIIIIIVCTVKRRKGSKDERPVAPKTRHNTNEGGRTEAGEAMLRPNRNRPLTCEEFLKE